MYLFISAIFAKDIARFIIFGVGDVPDADIFRFLAKFALPLSHFDAKYTTAIGRAAKGSQRMMSENGRHSEDEVQRACESLHGWVRERRATLAVAAMLATQEGAPEGVSMPGLIVAGALGDLDEADIAVLLAQLEVAVMMSLGQLAEHAEMGEAAFRGIVRAARRHLLEAFDMSLCEDRECCECCGGDGGDEEGGRGGRGGRGGE